MMLAWWLWLAVAQTPPSVAVLPCARAEGVSAAEARRFDQDVRRLLGEASGEVSLLPTTRRDAKDAQRCALEPACLADLAYQRGADLLAATRLSRSEAGLVAEWWVVGPDPVASPTRHLREEIDGARGPAGRATERLWRRAFLPQSVVGTVRVRGAPDDALLALDGFPLGRAPLSQALTRVRAGTHVLSAEKPGYYRLERRIEVAFGEEIEVDMALVPLAPDANDRAAPLVGDGEGTMGAWGTLGAGALLVAGSGLTGAAAVLTAQEVERRAARQLLVFPRDAELLRRGEAWALATYGLFSAGSLLGAGGALWLWSLRPSPGAADGAGVAP